MVGLVVKTIQTNGKFMNATIKRIGFELKKVKSKSGSKSGSKSESYSGSKSGSWPWSRSTKNVQKENLKAWIEKLP